MSMVLHATCLTEQAKKTFPLSKHNFIKKIHLCISVLEVLPRKWLVGRVLKCYHSYLLLEVRLYKVRGLFLQVHLCFKKRKITYPPPSQAFFTTKPIYGHAVCTNRLHPPTSPRPNLSAHIEPISRGHCQYDIMKLKVSRHISVSLFGKELTCLHTAHKE